MQVRDLSPVGAMSFLAGEGEMARRIREKDWSQSPLGVPEVWPQSLRSALGICLNSAFPTAIYWGPELRLLYNDAWAPIPGPRHPAALGAPAREVWSDIWHVIEPQFARLLSTGEGVFAEDQMLPMQRHGAPEETYWSYSFTPIRGEDGAIAGVFNSGHETTAQVLSQRRMGFLLELAEAFRGGEGDPEAARRTALGMLGRHLRAERVGIVERGEADALVVAEEWTAEGVAPLGTEMLSRIDRHVGQAAEAGRVLRIDDAASDPGLDPAERATFGRHGIRAAVAATWLEGGRLAGVIYVTDSAPRDWNDFEIGTVQEALERARAWIERERTREHERIMVREIDHRARNVLAIAQSVVRTTEAKDIAGFRTKVEARIAALARTHSLLASRRWHEVEFATLLEQELEPYAGAAAVSTSGPEVRLRPDQAQALALVLHELATNAAKHGALGAGDGRLRVAWDLTPLGLRLDWHEEAGSAGGNAADSGEGFGATLLELVVERQLRGRIDWEPATGGLSCRIDLPLADESPAPDRDVNTAPGARSVLIVEDEAIIAMDLEAVVGDLGYEVFGVFATVPAALAALETARPDVALLDANLRGESSLPIAERLHALGVPVVFATGYEAVPDLPAGLADAPRLTKPLSREALVAAIERAMR